MSHHLTTPNNEFEATIILTRLREAGISGWESNSLGGRAGSAGPRDIYVDDADAGRAEAALSAARDVDDDELDELSQQTPPDEGEPA